MVEGHRETEVLRVADRAIVAQDGPPDDAAHRDRDRAGRERDRPRRPGAEHPDRRHPHHPVALGHPDAPGREPHEPAGRPLREETEIPRRPRERAQAIALVTLRRPDLLVDLAVRLLLRRHHRPRLRDPLATDLPLHQRVDRDVIQQVELPTPAERVQLRLLHQNPGQAGHHVGRQRQTLPRTLPVLPDPTPGLADVHFRHRVDRVPLPAHRCARRHEPAVRRERHHPVPTPVPTPLRRLHPASHVRRGKAATPLPRLPCRDPVARQDQRGAVDSQHSDRTPRHVARPARDHQPVENDRCGDCGKPLKHQGNQGPSRCIRMCTTGGLTPTICGGTMVTPHNM